MRVAANDLALNTALHQARTEAEAAFGNGAVYLEDAYPAMTISALAAMGHPVTPVSEFLRTGYFGRGQIIVRDRESGVLWAGSDPRSDGAAVGF